MGLTNSVDNSNVLKNAKDSVISKFKALGIDHDKFFNELKKYNGVISGSFMFMNLLNVMLNFE